MSSKNKKKLEKYKDQNLLDIFGINQKDKFEHKEEKHNYIESNENKNDMETDKKLMKLDTYKERKKYYLKYLEKYYGYDEFRKDQCRLIDKICYYKNDCCGIFPTGHGKSIIYQLPSVILKKMVFVISPLISLMKDQVVQLNEKGISATTINSSMKAKERYKTIDDCINGKYKVVYITPEFIEKNVEFFEKCKKNTGICLFSIDESHCISSWGNSFRPSYQKLSVIKELFPDIPVIALTATATIKVEEDICKKLKLNDPYCIRGSFDRKNIKYYVKFKRPKSKLVEDLKEILIDEPMIIYCQTRKETERLTDKINELGTSAGFYHADMSPEDRDSIQDSFMNDTISCIVATISFGLGINKGDIKRVVHYGAPKDIESYMQESGRAGRNGDDAESYIYYNGQDFKINEFLIASHGSDVFKEHRLNMLEYIKQYLETSRCRRKLLLDYFKDEMDDDIDKEKCCDNCAQKMKQYIDYSDSESEKMMYKNDKIDEKNITKNCNIILKLINEVPLTGIGNKNIHCILNGKNPKTAIDCKRLSTFGSLKISDKELSKLINILIRQKFIIKQKISGGSFFASFNKITEKGIRQYKSDNIICLDE